MDAGLPSAFSMHSKALFCEPPPPCPPLPQQQGQNQEPSFVSQKVHMNGAILLRRHFQSMKPSPIKTNLSASLLRPRGVTGLLLAGYFVHVAFCVGAVINCNCVIADTHFWAQYYFVGQRPMSKRSTPANTSLLDYLFLVKMTRSLAKAEMNPH